MIVASVSTIPDRLDSLITVLGSLELQTVKPDFLIVNVYEYYPRLNKYYQSKDLEKLKSFLEHFSITNRLIMDVLDIGPISKLLSPLNNLNLTDSDYIFIFDDDTPLYIRTIETLFESHQKGPGAVYGLIGGRSGNFYHSEYLPLDFEFFVVNILGGYRGCLYPISIFDKNDFKTWCFEILNRFKELNMLATHDDHIFSYYFKSKFINRRVAKFLGDRSILNYKKIENTDGIFNDKNVNVSMNILEDWIKEKNLGWLLESPY